VQSRAPAPRAETTAIGIGSYTVPEAARLLRIPRRNVQRWLAGYAYRSREGGIVEQGPLWHAQFPAHDDHIELGFRDLIELRFISAFISEGLSLLVIRRCLDHAREVVQDEHPFSTRRFKTDGRTIFLKTLRDAAAPELLDLKRRQYVIHDVIERTFRDLDVEDDIVVRWRPFEGKPSIVLDPTRAFGQPIATKYGIPTLVLFEAAKAEGSPERAAEVFETSVSAVRDAVRFEQSLRKAA
jgi:uncharacterized protein (DUF433 family)/DNA-binding transcriptional MerR regulator